MASWRDHRWLTGIIWLLVAVAIIVVSVGVIRTPELSRTPAAVSCADLEESEVARSRRLLRTNLSGSITAAEFELSNVQAELREEEADLREKEAELVTATDDLESLEADRKRAQDELTSRLEESDNVQVELSDMQADLRVAQEAKADQSVVDALMVDVAAAELQSEFVGGRIGALKERIEGLNAPIGALNAEIGAIEAEIEDMGTAVDSLIRTKVSLKARLEAKNLARGAMLNPTERKEESDEAVRKLSLKQAELAEAQAADGGSLEIGALSDAITLLELNIASLNHPRWALAAEAGLDSADAYLPARADVNLVSAEPVSRILLGSHRVPSRVEIVLESARLGGAEIGAISTEDVDIVVAPSVELPDKATYLAEAGQFRRGDGPEIAAEQISVWARRVGTVVVMSVCITPGDIHAGLYEGDVYLVDPSLNPTRVRVEIAAQSIWINLLYGLVLILPIAALFYLWFTSRHSADEDAWAKRPFFNWLKKNLAVAFVVGFAAVWATLAGPLRNPTWGTSSLLDFAAVIGVGLVASFTAMTAVSGKIRGPGIDDQSKGTRGQGGSGDSENAE